MEHVPNEWYTAEEKNRIVQDYLRSGLSLRKYSERNNVKLPTLSAWIRKYNQENQITSNFQNVTPILKQDVSEIKEQAVSVPAMVKITLPNGITIECPVDVIDMVLRGLS